MKRIVPLDLRGRRHLKNELAYFGGLGERVLRCVDLDDGIIEAVVPFDSSQAAYQFRRSGFTERSGTAEIDAVTSSQRELLDGLVGGAPRDEPATALLVESLIMEPQDLPSLSTVPGEPLVIGRSVVFATRPGATRREFDDLLGVVYAVPGGLGVLTAAAPDGLRPDILDGLLGRAVRIFLGAYDGEGVISWRPRSA
jgi:hypothetical protein